MDRLPLVVLCAALAVGPYLAGCERSAETGAATDGARGARQRVNAVAAAPEPKADPSALCDVFHEGAAGPAFAWPALAGTSPELPRGRWAWVNVWATWCKPCVEELPRLRRWQNQLGDRVSFYFVSADDSDQVIEGYKKSHPDLPPTGRVANPDKLPDWLQSLGVTSAALPVHVVVAPDGKVRCVRASGVEDSDFPAVEALFEAPTP